MTGVVLQTDRLILRRLDLADLNDLVELDRDPEVMRYITGGIATPRAEIERKLPLWIDDPVGVGRVAALDRASGAFLGWFGLRSPTPDVVVGLAPGDAELGYRLRRTVWGSGYATEGSCALVALAFGELDVPRVIATTMAVNAASRRVMEKVGLRYLSTFHLDWTDPIDGAAEGDVLYGLTRDEYGSRSDERQRSPA